MATADGFEPYPLGLTALQVRTAIEDVHNLPGNILHTDGGQTIAGNTSWTDDSSIYLGDGQDLRLFHLSSNSNSYIRHTGEVGTELRIESFDSINMVIDADNDANNGVFTVSNGTGTDFITITEPTGNITINPHLGTLTLDGTTQTNGTLTATGTVTTNDQFIINGTTQGAGQIVGNNHSGNLSFGDSTTLDAISGGADNIMIGNGAGTDLTSANNNIGIGTNALSNITTSLAFGNVGIGTHALISLAGDSDTNVGIGNWSLSSTNLADNNTAIGADSGSVNITGSDNTFLGYSAGPNNTFTALQNTTCIGYNARSSTSNTIVLGNSQITSLLCYDTTISSPSDKRDKYDIQEISLGLEFINELHPVNFKYDFRDDYIEEVKNEDGSRSVNQLPYDGRFKRDTEKVGFIAQEVKEAIEKLNVNFCGLKDISPGDEKTGDKYSIDYPEFIAPIVKAIQQLSDKIDKLENL